MLVELEYSKQPLAAIYKTSAYLIQSCNAKVWISGDLSNCKYESNSKLVQSYITLWLYLNNKITNKVEERNPITVFGLSQLFATERNVGISSINQRLIKMIN